MNLFLYALLTIIKGASILYPNNYYQLLFLNWIDCKNAQETITYLEDNNNNNQIQFPINSITGLCSGNFNQYDVDVDYYQLHFIFNRSLQVQELLIISIQGKNYTIPYEINDTKVGINHKHIQNCQKTIDFWLLSNNVPLSLIYFEITDITPNSSSNKVYKDQYFDQEILLEYITQYNWQTKSIQINNNQTINYQAVLNFVNLTSIKSRLQAKISIDQNQMKCQYTDLDLGIYFNCNLVLETTKANIPIQLLQLYEYIISIKFDYVAYEKYQFEKQFQAILQLDNESNSSKNYKIENNFTESDLFKVNLQLSDYKLEDQTLQFSIENDQKSCNSTDFGVIKISIFNQENEIYYNLEYKSYEINQTQNCIITLQLDDQITINKNLTYLMNITIIFRKIPSSPIFFFQNNSININQGFEEQEKQFEPQTTIIFVVFYVFISLILFMMMVSIFPARYYFYILIVLNKFIQTPNFNESLPQPTNSDASPYVIRQQENERLNENQVVFNFQNQ